MSKGKSLMCLLILICSLFVPMMNVVNAEEKEPVTVYIFHGSTCPHCQDALAFFKKLLNNKEFKGMFQVRALEIWGDEENSEIANEACEILGDEPINGSVPYIVIGDQSFGGYSSASDSSIKEAIKNAYNDHKEDKLKSLVGERGELLEADESQALTTIIVLVVAAAIIGGTIFFARSGADEEGEEKAEIKKEEIEEKKEEPVKEETQEKKNTPKKTTNSNKKNGSKKTNTKKTTKKSN